MREREREGLERARAAERGAEEKVEGRRERERA